MLSLCSCFFGNSEVDEAPSEAMCKLRRPGQLRRGGELLDLAHLLVQVHFGLEELVRVVRVPDPQVLQARYFAAKI